MPEKATAALQKLYKKVNGVALPYKAILNGDTDTVLATVNVTDTNIKLDSIVFKTQNGAKIDFKRNDRVFVLTLKGKLTYAEEQILATIKQGDKWKVIGAFMLVHISPKTIKLNLVPTNGVNITAQKQKEIKDIYSKVAVNVDIAVKSPFDITQYLVNNKLTTEDELGDLSTYSDAQNRIISDYKTKNTVGLEYYIFVTDNPSDRDLCDPFFYG